MNFNKLTKIQERITQARRSPQKASDLEKLAKQLGRSLFNRGKEPTWVSVDFPHLRPLTIPRHGSKDVSPFVKKTVLNQLELDISAWEEICNEDHEDGKQS